jgi:hypothetical protein
LALKKPPPFVPSCLIATWEAAGPRGIVCRGDRSTTCAVADASRVCTTPRETRRDREEDRELQLHVHVERRGRPRSCPSVLARAAREAPDQRDEDRQARRRRDEVLDGEPEHLREGAERRLARVSLPVRVRGEADGRVERGLRRDRS